MPAPRDSEEVSRDLGISKEALQHIGIALKEVLGECSRVLVFDSSLKVIACTFQVNPGELRALSELANDRDNAIRKGVVLDGRRFEVHRHHPPLVYGRSADGEPEQSEGVAVCKVDKGIHGKPIWAAATYGMPFVSARMVPLVQEFCRKVLEAPAQ